MKKEIIKQNEEKKTILFSLFAGIVLLIIGIVMSIKTDSQAMLMDALYDSIDIIIVIVTLFLIKLYHRPISEKKPFGFSQLESFFLLIKTFMVLALNVSIIVEKNLLNTDMKVLHYDIIKTGRKIWISIYFKSSNNIVDINQLKEKTMRCSEELNEKIGNVYFEFGADRLFGYNMQKFRMPGQDGLVDTMCDLIVDTIGAIVACIGGYIYIKRKKYQSNYGYLVTSKYVMVWKKRNK